MSPRRILVIRRDNIGDLLLTTPMISALRGHFPDARLEMLVNSYNAPVLIGNPDIDAVHVYTKAKHSDGGKLAAIWAELSLFLDLRRRRYDLVIHANPTPHKRTGKLVHFLKPGAALGVVAPDDRDHPYTIPLLESELTGVHHAERVMSLLRPLGIDRKPGAMTLISSAISDDAIGIHLSSRKPCNRWPIEHYAEVIHGLLADGHRIRLFWAPGSRDDARHPGDDELLTALMAKLDGAVEPVRTRSLSALIDGLASCRAAICCDGGALHIAAALGKPMVALFGCTDANRWGPWATANQVLNGGGQAANIAPGSVLNAARSPFFQMS